MCNKAVIKYPVAPEMCHYTTLMSENSVFPSAAAVLLKDKLARILTCCTQQLQLKMKPVY